MVGSNRRFDPTSPCLVVAPHLEYPVRNGADILIDRKYAHFSEHVPFVDLIGKRTVVRYAAGRPVRETPYANSEVPKYKAALRTLRRRSHYLLEKFVTPDFLEMAGQRLSDPGYKTVVFSHVWAASAVPESSEAGDRLYCIETHNDEFRWYENIRRSSANPLAKLTAHWSERWATSFVEEHASDFVFLHVSTIDHRGFLSRFPDHEGYVVPIGVEEIPEAPSRQENPATSGKLRLMFVGSLGVKINHDALEVFRKLFYPQLNKEFGNDLEVLVVGSNPSRKVTKLCENMGWTLYPNVSDQRLAELYETATFSILPFGYTTGSKLKLLDSLARGVPYLATESLRDQVEEITYPCLISNDSKEWSRRLREVRERRVNNNVRAALKEQAQKYSWEAIARRTFELLEQEGRHARRVVS